MFHILSQTTTLSVHDVLQGIITTIVTAWDKTDHHYERLDKNSIVEMVDFLREILSGISIDAKEEELQKIADDVCFAMLPSIEGAVFGSQSQRLGLDSQLYQSICQLLSLCIVVRTDTSDTNTISTRVQNECINAFSVYKEESDFISGGTGDQVTFDKHLNIHTAISIISNVFDMQVKLGNQQVQQTISSEWIQTCFNAVLSVLESSQTNVCTQLSGVILPKILQTEPHLQIARCSQLWKVIGAIHKLNIKETNSNVFITLCGVVNHLLPYGARQQDDDKIFSVAEELGFWTIVQSGLVHSDPLARKQSLFLLKRAIDLFSSSRCDVDVKGNEDSCTPLFSWKVKKSKQLLGIWADFFLLYETLQEVQVRILSPELLWV